MSIESGAAPRLPPMDPGHETRPDPQSYRSYGTAISVVVPTRNDARYIGECLDGLVGQAEIGEIIIVDNGSTDETVAIVRSYCGRFWKVRLLHERRPGVAIARDTGFAAAVHEFIGRIDADTRVDPDWAATIRDHLITNPGTAAITGITATYDSPVRALQALNHRARQRLGLLGGPARSLDGANMGIRRQSWLAVLPEVNQQADHHEDLDLTLCLRRRGQRIDELTGLRARTSSRRRAMTPAAYWRHRVGLLRVLTAQQCPVPLRERLRAVLAWLAHLARWPLYRLWSAAGRGGATP